MRKILLAGATTLAGCSVLVPTAVSLSANASTTANRPAAAISGAAHRVSASAAPDELDEAGDDHDRSGRDDRTVTLVSLHPTVVVHDASVEEQAWVDTALVRFAEASLPLPDLDVVFADDATECGGHDGLFVAGRTPWQVLVCSDLAFIVTHEFAHAWEAANLDDDDRTRYVERRGLSTWNSDDAEWLERGVEDMAFMLQQNLMAGAVSATSDRWVERTDAYAMATGHPSPVLQPADERDGRGPFDQRRPVAP